MSGQSDRKLSPPLDAFPGFHSNSDGRRLRFDRKSNAFAVTVGQADFYVTSNPREYIETVLGSCIAVCMYDPAIRCGGMNHFVLPEEPGNRSNYPSLPLRYGAYSIERLVNALLGYGAHRKRIEAKVFGGGNVVSFGANVGHRNADFVEDYLDREGFTITARHLRGTTARKLRYFPTTGVVQLQMLGVNAADPLVRTELELRRRLQQGEREKDNTVVY